MTCMAGANKPSQHELCCIDGPRLSQLLCACRMAYTYTLTMEQLVCADAKPDAVCCQQPTQQTERCAHIAGACSKGTQIMPNMHTKQQWGRGQ